MAHCEEVLGSSFRPLDRPTNELGNGAEGTLFGTRGGLGTETATHVGGDDVYVATVEAEDA